MAASPRWLAALTTLALLASGCGAGPRPSPKRKLEPVQLAFVRAAGNGTVLNVMYVGNGREIWRAELVKRGSNNRFELTLLQRSSSGPDDLVGRGGCVRVELPKGVHAREVVDGGGNQLLLPHNRRERRAVRRRTRECRALALHVR